MSKYTFSEDNRASYCPEDNKLRLYVGRVPRPEYDALRAEGWTATPKQSCDFVAHWTPQRRQTALAYAPMIDDEDQSPEERAADRAERFSGYRDKRAGEALGHAERYDGQPLAHGFQNQARADRAAARHDRIADRATDQWSKAEYWQTRTAGVISHALYKSTLGVRMGRIKILEAELRRMGESTGEWATHYRLRLAYENQMCEAEGGRAALVEMIPGGWLGERQIRKVNKSNASGQVVSVEVMGMSRGYNGPKVPCPVLINVERFGADVYTPPSEADITALAETFKAEKAARPKVEPCPLINPTDEDAEKLQAIWNTQDREPSEVLRLTQAQYSARSGSMSSCETVIISEFGTAVYHGSSMWNRTRSEVFKVRRAYGQGFARAYRVIILTDKPQKPIPWAAVEKAKAKHPTRETMRPRITEIAAAVGKSWLEDTTRQLLQDAAYVGWVSIQSMSQIYWTDEGIKELRASQPQKVIA